MKRKRRGNYPKRRPLGPLHYAAIELLSACGRDRLTYEQAAAKLGVDRRTIYRWRQCPDFQRVLQKAIDRKIYELDGSRRKWTVMNAALTGDTREIQRFFDTLGFNVG